MRRYFFLFGSLMVLFVSCCTVGKTKTDTLISYENDEQMNTLNNKFAFNLLGQTIKDEKDEANICVSPLSASLALSMTAGGARGETRSQMMDVLGFSGIGIDKLNSYQCGLVSHLLTADSLTTIGIANSIWMKEGFPVKESFVERCKRYYDAEVESVPFDNATLHRINDWCSQKTNQRIPKILDEIAPDMVMFLLNAIYFKGSWVEPFNKNLTGKEPFFLASGDSVQVNMMHKKTSFPYYENDSLQMITLPFGNGSYAITFILPKEGVSADGLAASLTPEYWEKSKYNMIPQEVRLSLPRFTMQYSIKLNGVLQQMGMRKAFLHGADFSGIADAPLCIDEVKQKTFIKVDEVGTEAAAVTSVGIRLTSAAPQPCPNMVIDRPFLFVLNEQEGGNILFTGKIGEPKEE